MLVWLLACYQKVAYLDPETWLGKMKADLGLLLLQHCRCAITICFTGVTFVSHRKAVRHIPLYGEQRSYQLGLMLPTLITPLSQPCNL